MLPKYKNWHFKFALLLLVLSLILYIIHFLVFRDPHHIFVFLLEDIAFIPIHVLLITLIIEKIMNERDKQATFSKLNLVVGAFFNEVGTPLLTKFMTFDQQPEQVKKELVIGMKWSDAQFFAARKNIAELDYQMESRQGELADLRDFLAAKRGFMLALLENPSLTEYESFSDLLLAVFHVNDELVQRENLQDLPDSDLDHISVDLERAYRRLLFEWLRHMNHIKRNYPYLYSLAVRTNPFDPKASPIVLPENCIEEPVTVEEPKKEDP